MYNKSSSNYIKGNYECAGNSGLHFTIFANIWNTFMQLYFY